MTAVRTASTRPAPTRPVQTRSTSRPSAQTRAPRPPRKVPLPAGRPREWYEAHNRQLKAMRLAIALLDAGVYGPRQATDRRIRGIAQRLGVRHPSRTTCSLVRELLPAQQEQRP